MQNSGYTVLQHAPLDSPVFKTLSMPAKCLYYEFCRAWSLAVNTSKARAIRFTWAASTDNVKEATWNNYRTALVYAGLIVPVNAKTGLYAASDAWQDMDPAPTALAAYQARERQKAERGAKVQSEARKRYLQAEPAPRKTEQVCAEKRHTTAESCAENRGGIITGDLITKETPLPPREENTGGGVVIHWKDGTVERYDFEEQAVAGWIKRYGLPDEKDPQWQKLCRKTEGMRRMCDQAPASTPVKPTPEGIIDGALAYARHNECTSAETRAKLADAICEVLQVEPADRRIVEKACRETPNTAWAKSAALEILEDVDGIGYAVRKYFHYRATTSPEDRERAKKRGRARKALESAAR